MRRHRVRGGQGAFVYLAIRGLLRLVVLVMHSQSTNRLELLALRHEVAVLRRQVGALSTSPPTMPSRRR